MTHRGRFSIGIGFYMTARSDVSGLNWRANNLLIMPRCSFAT